MIKIKEVYNEECSNPRGCFFCYCRLSYEKDGTTFAVGSETSKLWIWICSDCLKELRSRIDALSILITTGVDTK